MQDISTNLSLFGEKFTRRTGILELMDDMAVALSGPGDPCMLGGGNPAHIPEMCRMWKKRMKRILRRGCEFEAMVTDYDSPQGRWEFLEALADLLRREYGWNITAKNVAVTNGSQSAFFLLFNMFSGLCPDGTRRRILFPLSPEYIGYADQALEPTNFVSRRSEINLLDRRTFKYHIDFQRLEIGKDIGAVCVSRPTNPTGNVLTDLELGRLSGLCREKGIPLLVDNAYGCPFPNIVFEDVKPLWDDNTVVVMSLSKLGLPAVRTGIVIAAEPVISAVAAMNTVVSLASGSIGPLLLLPFVQSGEILRISREIVQPYYRRKSRKTIRWIAEALDGRCEYAVHKSEGAFFLWIWFRNLPVTTGDLYQRLKSRNVIVVPGSYFFYGLEEPWDHRDECIRLNFSQEESRVQRGIGILAEEVSRLFR